MVEDSLVVKDIRRIRRAISEQFDHDINKYIDYLQGKGDASGQPNVIKLPSEWPPKNEKSTGNKD